MTTIDVLIPSGGDDPQRARLLAWVLDRFDNLYFKWPIHFGTCRPGPFNRAEAILDAARKSTADIVVVSDADVWCGGTRGAVEHVDAADCDWAVPHHLIHRLSRGSTEQVLAGADWEGLPLSNDNTQDSRPYKGNETGTLFVIRREVLLDVPPDVRFVGWGQEDTAHAAALRTLVGPPWRGTSNLVHLWHEPQPRMTRVKGNPVSVGLERRYREARGNQRAMRALIAESKQAAAA